MPLTKRMQLLKTDISGDNSPKLGGILNSNQNQIQWSKGVDVASANALVLGTDGNTFDITGTTTITSISTLSPGTLVLLHFDSALTLTHHSTDLILPDGVNIKTAAGDNALFFEYTTGSWRCINYQRSLMGVSRNLLTNSGVGVWSNAEDLYTTGDTVPASGDGFTHDAVTCDDDAVDDESADWSETGGGAITYDTDIYDFDGSAANEYVHSAADFAALTEGKQYEMQIYFSDEAAAQTVQMGVFTAGAAAFTAIGPDITTDGGGVTYNRMFTADGTERRIGFKVTSNPGGAAKINWKDTLLHEVTPGIVGANTLGPDGWTKTEAADIWREHSGANTQDGSFYALKILSSGQGIYEVYQILGDDNTVGEAKYIGKTITFGAWVKTDAASQVKLTIYDDTEFFSSENAGSGWEWLEVTRTITGVATRVGFNVDNGKTAYISQPMLVFGTHIGAGNYSQPPGEIVWFETNLILTDYNGVTVSANATINSEAQSNGKIPKNIKAARSLLIGSCATLEKTLYTQTSTSAGAVGVQLYANVANNRITATGFQPCDANGDFAMLRDDTFNEVSILIEGVQL